MPLRRVASATILPMMILAMMVHPAAAATAADTARAPGEAESAVEARETIPTAWLDRGISVEQAEAAHPGLKDERVARFPEAARPFGFQHAQWEAFKSDLRPGDELWTFASPPESWRHLAGRAGLAILRGGKVVRTMVTILN